MKQLRCGSAQQQGDSLLLYTQQITKQINSRQPRIFISIVFNDNDNRDTIVVTRDRYWIFSLWLFDGDRASSIDWCERL